MKDLKPILRPAKTPCLAKFNSKSFSPNQIIHPNSHPIGVQVSHPTGLQVSHPIGMQVSHPIGVQVRLINKIPGRNQCLSFFVGDRKLLGRNFVWVCPGFTLVLGKESVLSSI